MAGRLGGRPDHGEPARDRLRRVIDAFREGGGAGKPLLRFVDDFGERVLPALLA